MTPPGLAPGRRALGRPERQRHERVATAPGALPWPHRRRDPIPAGSAPGGTRPAGCRRCSPPRRPRTAGRPPGRRTIRTGLVARRPARITRKAALVPTLIAARPGLVAPDPRLPAAPSPMAGHHRASANCGNRRAKAGRSPQRFVPHARHLLLCVKPHNSRRSVSHRNVLGLNRPGAGGHPDGALVAAVFAEGG